jgi:hypothetical protein
MTDEQTPTITSDGWRDLVADAQEVEVHWQETRYHLGEAPTDSAEAARLRAEMQQLRDEYARLIEEARRHGRELALALLSSPGDAQGFPEA